MERNDSQLNIRAPASLVVRLRAMAAQHDRTVGWELRRAITERLEREERFEPETPAA